MDKKSGVYLTLTDNSFQTPSDTQEIKGIVPMLTTKGLLGLNRVTLKNFKDILGYDLSYNPNYYGLSEMLGKVDYLDVWRINQGATCANVYWNSSSVMGHKTGVTSVDGFESSDKLVVMNSSAGNVGSKAIRITRRKLTKSVGRAISTDDNENPIEIDGVSSTANNLAISVDGTLTNFFGGIEIYDSANVSRIAVLKSSSNGYDVYRCASGLVDMSEAIGTATIASNKLTLKITKAPNSNASWVVRYFDSDAEEWTLDYADYVDEKATNIESFDFSLDSESDIYINKVDFGDLTVKNNSGITSSFTSDWCALTNGSNGVTAGNLSVFDLDVSVLNTTSANFMFMNGFFENVNVINAIAEKADSMRIHTFVDVPAFSDYISSESWSKKIFKSKYVALCAIPNEIEGLYVYPSVKYCGIYSDMLADTGSLNYPPAGHTYGSVNANNLIENDFGFYGNELKTNRINYVVTDNIGTCIWEQRTTYGLNTDLSYIAPTFIVDNVCDELIDFERQFNFRYSSAMQLITQESGIKSILDAFKSKGFLYSYSLDVPSYDEIVAQKNREVNISAEIQVAKDSEVINIGVVLKA